MNKCRSLFSIIFIFALVFASCGAADSHTSKYGEDSYYFKAVIAVNEHDYPKARKLLYKSLKGGSSLVRRRSLELLSELGSVDENIYVLGQLYKTYPDDDSLLLYVKGLYKKGDFQKIIDETSSLNLTSCLNELGYYRCAALYKKASDSFARDFNLWVTGRAYSKEQTKFLEDFKLAAGVYPLVEFRKKVNSYDYNSAMDDIEPICKKKENLVPQIVNDIGKCYLYAPDAKLEYAESLEKLASSENFLKDSLYNAYFYIGRIYNKNAKYQEKACAAFIKAMDYAGDDFSYDNALWYYLNSALKISIKDAIDALKNYGPSIHDKDYFDDFFETLSLRMISRHVWSAYYQTAISIEPYASKETVAKYSYVSARLLQEGLLKLDGIQKKDLETKLFKKALDSGTSIYYRVLAALRLGLSEDELKNELKIIRKDESFVQDKEEENLLCGYADYGLYDYIFPEWENHWQGLGIECVQKISEALYGHADKDDSFYTKSLRIASKKLNLSESELNETLFKLSYPQAFAESVKKYCNEYKLDQYVAFGLIRAESFFDPSVKSHAGATGLAQLMDGTASDVAKKLKISVYDLTDADTNVRFGTYYLSELIGRLDGSVILSLFAYNGGIGHVRSWLKSAALNFNMENMPRDLFLESLPFGETREYGRRVTGYASIYAMLYYNQSAMQIAGKILE